MITDKQNIGICSLTKKAIHGKTHNTGKTNINITATVDNIVQDVKNNEEEENPHLHLHLLTHPDQQAMHIRCTDKVCSTCANSAPSGSAEILLQSTRHSFSDMDSPSLRDEIEPGECKLHGYTGKFSNIAYTSKNKCFVHGTNNPGIIMWQRKISSFIKGI